MTSADVRQGQHCCSRGHCLSLTGIFDIIFWGLTAHLLGKDLIHGLDI
jgi:hypothetical protein